MVVVVGMIDKAAMEARMDDIRIRDILERPLTEQEQMCLQIEEHGFGCHAGRVRVMLDEHPE